jgi:HAMP domain-containing protein
VKLAPKLTLLFLMIAITPLVIVGVGNYENSKRTIVRQTINHLISTSILKEAVLNRWIEDGKKDLQLLADRPYFKDSFAGIVQAHDSTDRRHLSAHQEIVEDRLAPLVKAGVFREIFILRPGDGQVLISTDSSQESKYQESQPYFVEGKKDTYIQNVTYSQSLEQTVMTIATPVRDRQGKLLSVLCGRLDLGELTKIMEQGRGHNQTEDTYLVNKFNFFVTEPRFGKNFALKKTVHTEGVNAALRGIDGTGFYLDYRGVPVIGAYRWLPKRELCLITEMDQSEALAPIVRMGWMVVGTALAIAIAAAGMAFLSARTVTRPVKRLVEGTKEIGRGNLDHQVGTSAGDEIGELSRAFDRMTLDLKTTTVSRDELGREKNILGFSHKQPPRGVLPFQQAGPFHPLEQEFRAGHGVFG